MIKSILLIAIISVIVTSAWAKPSARPELIPTSTYSIVGREPETGQLGVAVQSHYFAVGSEVAFAEAGEVERSLEYFEKAFRDWPRLKKPITRLAESELLPRDPEILEKILSVGL